MRYFTACSLLFLLLLPAAAQEKYLSDVPEGHYAYDAVSDLIRRGVTGGFPDGTYRGKQLMTRYDIAAFISKLAKSNNRDRGVNEKLLAELKNEVAMMKPDDSVKLSGLIVSRWRGGQNEAARGGKADYRLTGQVNRDFGDGASLKVGLDTMDAGYGGATRDLARELLDFEGKVKAGPLALRLTDGPGDVAHPNDTLFAADNGLRFSRPKRTIGVAADLGRTRLSLEYLARSSFAAGDIQVGETSVKVSQELAPFQVTINPRIFTGQNGNRDVRLDLLGEYRPAGPVNSTVLLGLAKNSDWPHGLFLKGTVDLPGGIRLLAQKIGSQYRETFTYSIFDLYDRALADGSTNYGLEVRQPLPGNWYWSAKGDYTDPGSLTTAELHLGRDFQLLSSLEIAYQLYNRAQQLSQAAGLTGSFKF